MIIATAGIKGGIGKSTTARHLAAWLAHKGFKVGILDTATRQLHSASWAQKRAENHHELPQVSAYKASGDLTNPIKKAIGECQVLVVDIAGNDEEALTTALPLSDFALLPSLPESDCTDDLITLAQYFDALKEQGVSVPPGIVFWSKAQSGLAYTWAEQEAEAERLKAAGFEVLSNRRIVHRVKIGRALKTGATVLDDPDLDPKAYAEVTALFEEIFDV